MKLNTDKCHLVAGCKFEHTVRVGPDKIWEDHSIKLLGVLIDNKLKCDKHVLNVKEANSKLGALSRLTKFMTLQKKGHFIKHFRSPNISTFL